MNESAHTILKKIMMLCICTAVGACNTTCSGGFSGNISMGDGDTTPRPKESLAPTSSAVAMCINGEMAMSHVQELVSLAPRHPGTEGHRKTRAYIVNTLKQSTLTPQQLPFTAYTPHPDFPKVEMENISVRFDGQTEKRILITGHFDGKIIEKGTFYGANDSGSSTALLLEMARCLKLHPQKESVQLLFLDGEEAFVKWTDTDSLYGSKHFVAGLLEKNETDNIAAVINVDMIGDRHLQYVTEQNSTGWVFAALRETAEKMGHSDLFSGPAASVGDDHLPFLQVGIPAANLIDFNYGPGWNSNSYWHTEADNMNHVSPDSMMITGQIVLSALPLLMEGPGN